MPASHDKVLPPQGARASRAGFALLEFLVAFTILAFFLASILVGVAVALRGDDRAEFMTFATTVAKSKLALAGIDFPLAPGVTNGRLGERVAWQAVVRPHGSIVLAPERVLRSYWVEVTVSDSARFGTRSVSLTRFAFREERRQ
ncbi:MAG: hypothetical protein IT536_19315 [Hyphomicrobiales bacterium]|nr:hypothetical protein [Hyphomicrobiales bacterium]